jgi:hypothetical protein
MKLKKVLNSIVGLHVLRHRQHKRFLRNAMMHARNFGPGKGLLMLGAMALGSYYLQKRHGAHQNAQLPEVGSTY